MPTFLTAFLWAELEAMLSLDLSNQAAKIIEFVTKDNVPDPENPKITNSFQLLCKFTQFFQHILKQKLYIAKTKISFRPEVCSCLERFLSHQPFILWALFFQHFESIY